MRYSMPLILLAMLGSSVAAASSPEASPAASQAVGGWTKGRVDAEVRKAARFGLRYLNRRNAQIRSIDAVDTQIVAGTNYRIAMTLSDGSRWQATVWKRLDNRYQFVGRVRIASIAQWPNGLPVAGNGFPRPGDPCRIVGESEATSKYLDDSATLVGCLSVDDATKLGGRVVGLVDGVTLVSVGHQH